MLQKAWNKERKFFYAKGMQIPMKQLNPQKNQNTKPIKMKSKNATK